jgi:hypothetical protein
MPRFSFHVSQGKFSHPVITAAFENSNAARQEALSICADLGRDIFAGLTSDSAWQMEVTDDSGTPIFRLRLSAESLDRKRLND